MEYVNPKVLFTRLTALAQWKDDVETYFKYELAVFPPSFFKDGLMRKLDKPSLRKALLQNTDGIEKDNLSPQVLYTIDGGALLHRVRWMKGWTFQNVAEHYMAYVKRYYGKEAYIVFDGYDKPSTKSIEHTRRSTLNRCPNINIVEANTVPCTQDQFLSNERNKAQLIRFVSRYLQNDGHTVTV